MSYSASAYAVLGVKLPREKVVIQTRTEHSCGNKTYDNKNFKFCPDCGKQNVPSFEEKCVFDKENNPDFLSYCPIAINGVELDDDGSYDDESEYFYLGLRVRDFAPISNDIISDTENKIFKVLYDYNIIKHSGAEEVGIPKEFRFGLHVILRESY